jgi:hypothetical protein
MSEYRGESRPRRSATRHHIELWSTAHQHRDVDDPFPPLSSSQFPALYTRSPVKNLYHQYMRSKAPYKKSRV